MVLKISLLFSNKICISILFVTTRFSGNQKKPTKTLKYLFRFIHLTFPEDVARTKLFHFCRKVAEKFYLLFDLSKSKFKFRKVAYILPEITKEAPEIPDFVETLFPNCVWYHLRKHELRMQFSLL